MDKWFILYGIKSVIDGSEMTKWENYEGTLQGAQNKAREFMEHEATKARIGTEAHILTADGLTISLETKLVVKNHLSNEETATPPISASQKEAEIKAILDATNARLPSHDKRKRG